jgi:hypothetical protein
MNNTELPPLDAIVEALNQIEKFIVRADLKTPEGVGELEMMCAMYAKGYILKLRAMK